jgi:hypothetical protein
MARELLNLKEIGRYLNVSAERACQVAASDPTLPAPAAEHPRRWSRAKVERWAERHWWDTRPWGKAPASFRRYPGRRHRRHHDVRLSVATVGNHRGVTIVQR